MIAAQFTWFAASPWMRTALCYGASVLLFLLTLRRSSERAGRLAISVFDTYE
jgi:hypothetical protein